MLNYLRQISTFKKHLTVLCMAFCGLNLVEMGVCEINVKCN